MGIVPSAFRVRQNMDNGVAQSERAPDYESGRCGFDSCRRYRHAEDGDAGVGRSPVANRKVPAGMGFDSLAIRLPACGVIGCTSHSDCEGCRFDSCRAV